MFRIGQRVYIKSSSREYICRITKVEAHSETHENYYQAKVIRTSRTSSILGCVLRFRENELIDASIDNERLVRLK